ncbi:hypothetical protein OA182_02815, partial [Candidatus Pelagibacter sp.]|nr:hypothetical protein [Candidatus Pelagibacter sp.]
FGSGKVVNDLTLEEKKKISESKVIFMNKNLIFWKHIGLWPNYYFLADTPVKSNKSIKIFNDTLKVAKDSDLKTPIFLFEKFYKHGVPKNLSCFFFNYNKSKNLTWAKNLNDVMFGHFGSLTTLLNLIDVLDLGKKVMLVGFDMNAKDYFFENDKKFNDYNDKSFFSEGNLHPNLEKINNKNIFSHWKIISDNFNFKNIKLYCNNQKSMIVKENLVEYMSINKFYEE